LLLHAFLQVPAALLQAVAPEVCALLLALLLEPWMLLGASWLSWPLTFLTRNRCHQCCQPLQNLRHLQHLQAARSAVEPFWWQPLLHMLSHVHNEDVADMVGLACLLLLLQAVSVISRTVQ
jgi:hypothetical protein